MKLLFLSRWFPYPPDNGAKLRVYNLIKLLSTRHQIHLISFCESKITDEQVEELSTYCQSVNAVVYVPFQPNSWRALIGYFHPLPRSVVDSFNPHMQEKIDQAVLREKYDLLIASQIDMVIYIRKLKGLPRLIEEIELSNLFEQVDRAANPLARFRSRMMWGKWKRYIGSMMKMVDAATVVSRIEQERLEQFCNQTENAICPIKIVPNGVDYAGNNSRLYDPPKPDTLIFTGALTYYANYDALSYFLEEIFPLIQAQHPAVHLFVTGNHENVSLDKLPSREGVTFTGYTPDILSLVAESWINIVPLRIGGGTRLKILESLSLGTPVIATSKGAEGLNLSPGKDLLIADEPEEFSEAVLCLLRDVDKRNHIGRNGQRTVFERYDWQKIVPDLCDFIEQVVSGYIGND